MQKMINFDYITKETWKNITQIGHKFLIIHTDRVLIVWGSGSEKQIHYSI